MTPELTYMTLTGLLTCNLWIPYIVGVVKTRGFLRPEDYVTARTSPLPDWVNRANRTHLNSVENFAPFAAVVLTLHVISVSSALTVAACAVFFWARVAHAIVHLTGFKVAMARTVIFTIGWAAFLVLVYVALTA